MGELPHGGGDKLRVAELGKEMGGGLFEGFRPRTTIKHYWLDKQRQIKVAKAATKHDFLHHLAVVSTTDGCYPPLRNAKAFRHKYDQIEKRAESEHAQHRGFGNEIRFVTKHILNRRFHISQTIAAEVLARLHPWLTNNHGLLILGVIKTDNRRKRGVRLRQHIRFQGLKTWAKPFRQQDG